MKRSSLAAIVIAGMIALYVRWIRPWQLRWGATDEEVALPMPGDEIARDPSFNATRAVTIKARPEDIWPWLVQIGMTRAGWYSYDWIDNFGKPSAAHVIPALQGLRIGDVVPMRPDGKQGLWVKEMEPPGSMLWWDKKGDVTWFWGLYPVAENKTRLVTRIRIRYHWLRPSIIYMMVVDVADIVMLRKCLLGIKERAEKLASRRRLA